MGVHVSRTIEGVAPNGVRNRQTYVTPGILHPADGPRVRITEILDQVGMYPAGTFILTLVVGVGPGTAVRQVFAAPPATFLTSVEAARELLEGV